MAATRTILFSFGFVFSFFAAHFARADILPISLPLSQDKTNLVNRAEFALVNSRVKSVGFLGSLNFRPLAAGFASLKIPDSINAIWIRFSFSNPAMEDSTLVISLPEECPVFYLFELDKQNLTGLGRSGINVPFSARQIPGSKKNISLLVGAHSIYTFFICFERYHSALPVLIPQIEKQRIARDEQLSDELKNNYSKIIQFFFAGFFFAIAIYSILKFFSRSKDGVYLVYAFQNLCSSLAITVYFNFPNLETDFFPWLRNSEEICSMLSSLTAVTSILFIQKILELRQHSKMLYSATSFYIAFHILSTIILPVIASPPSYILLSKIAFVFYSASETLYWLICISFVVYLWPRRTSFYTYLFYGYLVLTIGMTYFAFSSILITHETSIAKNGRLDGSLLLLTFIIAQVGFFLRALTIRERKLELENMLYQKQLIAQLSSNKLMQENFTKDLEKRIEERSRQVMLQTELLEKEREAKLLAVLNTRIYKTELKALRAQMNPHFIFNSLNSIENFMMKNDKKMASEYFAKFALLIRMILESSRSEQMLFEKDMEALKLYVELEQMRFGEKFVYKTVVDPELIGNDYHIPPLLIHPYVENAILHGLAPSTRHGLQLTITVTLENEYIAYTINDNGIGRAASVRYNKQRNGHKSMGMQITQERLNILNQQQDADGKISIEDLFDEAREPTGTSVHVRFKVM